jgi:hypothetical protein
MPPNKSAVIKGHRCSPVCMRQPPHIIIVFIGNRPNVISPRRFKVRPSPVCGLTTSLPCRASRSSRGLINIEGSCVPLGKRQQIFGRDCGQRAIMFRLIVCRIANDPPTVATSDRILVRSVTCSSTSTHTTLSK